MLQYTGEYKKHITSSITKMDFYTFTPSPLCGGLPLSIDDELFAYLTMAHKLLGVLEGMILSVSDIDIIKELFFLKESCCSLLVDRDDGIGFYDALKARSSKCGDLRCINNMIATQKYAYGKRINNSELSKICALIIHGPESTKKAEFRSKHLFFRRVLTNLKMYTPTAPEDIISAFQDLSKYISMDDHSDLLIKTALVHYQFEMIHPFEICNGVVGRVLIPMMLLNLHYQAAPYLCISEFLYHNKAKYFDILSSTQIGRGYTDWIKFFMEAVCFAAECAIAQIKTYTTAIVEDAPQISVLTKSSKYILPIYSYYKRHLVSEIQPVAEAIGISYNTAAKVVSLLVDAGILKQEHEQSRHKVFQYKKIIDAFVRTSEFQ